MRKQTIVKTLVGVVVIGGALSFFIVQTMHSSYAYYYSVDEFVIQERERIINVENAPSPAATASLNIGKLIVDKLEKQF